MGSRNFLTVFFFFLIIAAVSAQDKKEIGLGFNIGTITSHRLPAAVIVKMVQDNGGDKVKLFDADPDLFEALAGTGIKTFVGIPNDELERLGDPKQAEEYVAKNVSHYREKKVDIRYVGVGNEPFLKEYDGKFVKSLFPAVKNIHAALKKAGLAKEVQTTVPFNADILAFNGPASLGDFREDIKDIMSDIVKFFNGNKCPISVNFYPFFSQKYDKNFNPEYAIITDAPSKKDQYTNALDFNIENLLYALEKHGAPDMEIIVGEIGWPSEGGHLANHKWAQRFTQGLIRFIKSGRGTPKRPDSPPDIYLFGLLDENNKTIYPGPGPFERHWGIFNMDGSLKYNVDLGGGKNLTGAKGVKYLEKQWCVVKPDADESKLDDSIKYACDRADCSMIGNETTSCSRLDAKGKASYAFNSFFQTMNQKKDACDFNGLGTITKTDPSSGTCKFDIMIDTSGDKKSSSSEKSHSGSNSDGKHASSPAPAPGKSSATKITSLSWGPVLGSLFIFAFSYVS